MKEVTEFVKGFRIGNYYLLQYPYEVVEGEDSYEEFTRGIGYHRVVIGNGEYHFKFSKYMGKYEGNNYAYLKQIYSELPLRNHWKKEDSTIILSVVEKVEKEFQKKNQIYFPNASMFSDPRFLDKFMDDINSNEWKYNLTKSIPSFKSYLQPFKNTLCLLFSNVMNQNENHYLNDVKPYWSSMKNNNLENLLVHENDLLYVQQGRKNQKWFFTRISPHFLDGNARILFYHSVKNNPHLSTLSEHINSFLPNATLIPEIGEINQRIEQQNFQKRLLAETLKRESKKLLEKTRKINFHHSREKIPKSRGKTRRKSV